MHISICVDFVPLCLGIVDWEQIRAQEAGNLFSRVEQFHEQQACVGKRRLKRKSES
jgi:hypothetical protein